MTTPLPRYRVVVCGVHFGQIYLRALQIMGREWQLAGILARGSQQAQKLAHDYGVPLWHEVASLPDDINVACVVIGGSLMGGTGCQIAEQLLRRKVHVIQEHPIHHDELSNLLRIAHQHGCHYQINGFYPTQPAVSCFIHRAHQLQKTHPAVFIDAACSLQVLYPMLDILGQTVGGITPASLLTTPHDQGAPMRSLTGTINGIPLALRVQNQLDPDDPDNHMLMFHRVELITDGGRLLLDDTHGRVLWFPRRPIQSLRASAQSTQPDSDAPLHQVLHSSPPLCYETLTQQIWPQGVTKALRQLVQVAPTDRTSTARRQYSLALNRFWQQVGQQIGTPTLPNAMVSVTPFLFESQEDNDVVICQ